MCKLSTFHYMTDDTATCNQEILLIYTNMEGIKTCTPCNQSMDVVIFQKSKTRERMGALNMGHGVYYAKQITKMTI